ncbi:hypothetical protein WR25_13189 [Diploscapter pachys]|uniref:ATP-grasp domain-containing protein n=1 Tax=Diploscapter pachys TaxID=2018661 RepID=A0A2A2KPN9_9BILA|nr:hypothetical protein WR25_13189 [Diploscapter pachys]
MRTIIIVLWKYRLSLSKYAPNPHVRLIVVAPQRMLCDERNIDVYYQVEPPIRDHHHCQLIQKVRELCSMLATTDRRIVVFEKALQQPIAQIRMELDIEGMKPNELDRVLSIRNNHSVPRRNGFSTLRQCSLSGNPQPEHWLETVTSQVGGFPAVIRPIQNSCAHSIGFIRDENEFRSWLRRDSVSHNEQFVVEEYVENGHEFCSLFTARRGLIGCIASTETHRAVLECIQNQQSYALEYLSANQTRDYLPGLESFSVQVIKSVFSSDYLGVLFIRGYYKDHNDIFLFGFSFEPDCETYRLLCAQADCPWEDIAIESQFNLHENSNKNGMKSVSPPSSNKQIHSCVVNFPTAEGVLIHQATIPKRQSDIRVAWRVPEGQEMKNADTMDDNVLQVFLLLLSVMCHSSHFYQPNYSIFNKNNIKNE